MENYELAWFVLSALFALLGAVLLYKRVWDIGISATGIGFVTVLLPLLVESGTISFKAAVWAALILIISASAIAGILIEFVPGQPLLGPGSHAQRRANNSRGSD